MLVGVQVMRSLSSTTVLLPRDPCSKLSCLSNHGLSLAGYYLDKRMSDSSWGHRLTVTVWDAWSIFTAAAAAAGFPTRVCATNKNHGSTDRSPTGTAHADRRCLPGRRCASATGRRCASATAGPYYHDNEPGERRASAYLTPSRVPAKLPPARISHALAHQPRRDQAT